MFKIAITRCARPAALTVVLLVAASIGAHTSGSSVKASVAPQPARRALLVGDGPNRAAVAVKFGDGRVESRCVAFTEQSLGGDQLLERSGLVPAISPEGAVCSIGGEGCPTDNCFCQCETFRDCQYWAYYQWAEDSWAYSQFGATAASASVSNGGLQSWSWGAGDANTGAPPPDVTYDDVCRGSIEDATPTPTAPAGAAPPATSIPSLQPGANGGPTPTPLLIARAVGGSGAAPAPRAASNLSAGSSETKRLVESRSFSPQLLPGYAAYIATVAVLLVMAWYTLRRRGARSTERVVQPADEEERAPRSVRKE